MKYCIYYNKNSKILQEVDEITIKYNRKDTTLLDFLKLYENKRVNIYIADLQEFIENKEIEKLKAIYNSGITNFAIKLPIYDKDAITMIKETTIPFFIDKRVNNWDLFNGYVDLGVSDIYIVEELCFEIDKVAKIAHEKNVKIRTFPNVAQSQWEDLPDIKKFFIRPEDIDIYSKYIDVIEFFGRDEQIATYYKIYAKDKQWFGQLKEIIIGLNSDIDSRYIIPKFAEKRLSCGKNCLKGGKCAICDRIIDLSKTLEKTNIMVKNK